MHTSFARTRLRAVLAATAAAAFVAVPLATPASAGIDYPMPLYGEVLCDEDIGMNAILWELQNNTGEVVTIDDAVLFGALEGPEESWTITEIEPDVLSFAFTIVPVGVTGDVSLAVATSWVDGEFPMDADSVATVSVEPCEGPATTTTTTSTVPSTTTSTAAPTTTTTSTVEAAAVVAVVATPKFTG